MRSVQNWRCDSVMEVEGKGVWNCDKMCVYQ